MSADLFDVRSLRELNPNFLKPCFRSFCFQSNRIGSNTRISTYVQRFNDYGVSRFLGIKSGPMPPHSNLSEVSYGLRYLRDTGHALL